MELKEYLNNLRELTKLGQIKWERRVNSLHHVYDARIDEENTLSLIYENARVSIIVVCGTQSVQITNLDINGDAYGSLSKLWDTVYMTNLKVSVDKWGKALPVVDKKIKFGPKDTVA